MYLGGRLGGLVTPEAENRKRGYRMQSMPMKIGLILTVMLPNLAYAESVHPKVILFSASIIFVIILAIYVMCKMRTSLRNYIDKPLD